MGRAITLDNNSYTVIGVMPRGFEFPSISAQTRGLWTSLADDAVDDDAKDAASPTQRGADMITVVGRLKPGVTIAQANADLSVIAQNLAITVSRHQ